MMILQVILEGIGLGVLLVIVCAIAYVPVILSVMNLIDRFLIDGYWMEYTSTWKIPGTKDLKPYITTKDKVKKWLFGTVGMAVISAVLAAIMTVFIHGGRNL
jgi:ABC-type Fe3+ transport system permease subunit